MKFLIFLFSLIISTSGIAQNSFNIASIDSDDYTDLKFLDSRLANKRVVFLGESQHGINDFNIMKFRLIRYLHKRHNFEVVAFESGIANCGMTNLAKDSLNGMEILAHTLMGIWRVKGNCEMMDYVRNNHIEIAGIDPNNNALYLNSKRRNYFFKDISLSKQFTKLDSIKLFNYEFPRQDWIYGNGNFSPRRNDSISQTLKNGYNDIKKRVSLLVGVTETQKAILEKSIESTFRELSKGSDLQKKEDYFIDGIEREKLMASNLEFLLNTLYPDKKIIVWAHNGHIAKEGPAINNNISIGSYLPKYIKDRSFVIGLYATDGEFAWGRNKPQKLELDKGSIESIYNGFTSKGVFVPSTEIKSGMFPHGIPAESDDVSKLYDGIIFIRDVKASQMVFNKDYKCE